MIYQIREKARNKENLALTGAKITYGVFCGAGRDVLVFRYFGCTNALFYPRRLIFFLTAQGLSATILMVLWRLYATGRDGQAGTDEDGEIVKPIMKTRLKLRFPVY